MPFDKKKFLLQYIEDTRENLLRLNEGLLAFEKNPNQIDLLDGLLRAAHTIKGSSRMMQFDSISAITHLIEDIFTLFKDARLSISEENSLILFEAFDTIELMVQKLLKEESLPSQEPEICKKLESIILGDLDDKDETSKSLGKVISKKSHKKNKKESIAEGNNIELKKIERTHYLTNSETVRIPAESLDNLIRLIGEVVNVHAMQKERVDNVKSIQQLILQRIQDVEECEDCSSCNCQIQENISNRTDGIVKDLKKLLSNIRNDMISQKRVVTELQQQAMSLRMFPLDMVFGGLDRIVHDLAKSFEKKIEFVVNGEDTKLDKKIIDKISEPLIHLIRNAIDHAIETPEQRISVGKKEIGRIELSAGYVGESVVITVMDDGVGISLDNIRKRAVQKHLITSQEAENIEENELINMIFLPGFTTREIITDVSGRGIGMDVVKKVIEELKGSIRVKTEEGKWTLFTIRLPLTIAVMRIWLISVSKQIFAIPSISIYKIIRVSSKEIIKVVGGEAIHWSGEFIPICAMDELLGLEIRSQRGDETLILIVKRGSEKVGMIIDTLVHEDDMLIKPFPSHMNNISCVSGGILATNDRIYPVLHVSTLIDMVKEYHKTESVSIQRDENVQQKILVVDDSIMTREVEKNILESFGYEVDIAGNGLEALEKIKDKDYDAIVTDVEMPGLDGFNLTKRIREIPEFEDIPIILVTSLESNESKKKGIEVGASAYIVKGKFNENNLVNTIQNLVG